MKMPEGTKGGKKGTGIVRGHLPDIEKAVQDGYSLSQIFDVLVKDEGLKLTFEAFKNALSRVRREAKKGLADRQPKQPARLANGGKSLQRENLDLPEKPLKSEKPVAQSPLSLADVLTGKIHIEE